MGDIHHRLDQQLRQHGIFLESMPGEWRDFVDSVDRTYREFQNDRTASEVPTDPRLPEASKACTGMCRILQLLPEMCILVGIDGRIIDYNPGSVPFTMPTEKFVGLHITDLPFPGEFLRFIADGYRDVVQAKKGLSRDLVIREEGVTRYYTTSFRPIFNGETIIFVHDVTGYRQTEIALQESESRLKTILNSIQTAVLIIDAETHRIVDANPVALKMIGASREEIIDSVCFQHVCPSEVGKCPITDLGLTVDNSERVLITYSGARVPIIKNVTYVMLDNRKHLIESFVDISDRINAEKSLRKARDELEQRVRERTDELAKANEALKQEICERKIAEDAISASLREKVVLLKEVHHRVKNNLQIISSLLSLQASCFDDPLLKESFRVSQVRVKSMALVHENLYASGDLANIDFQVYLDSLATYLAQSYGIGFRRISILVDSDHVPLSVDLAIPCGLIISELITNAIKYAFVGRDYGRITVLFRGKGDGYLLAVNDDGIGIPESIDISNTRSLGMQLINILSEQIGGEISLDRTVGSTFSIAFGNSHKRVNSGDPGSIS